MARLNKEAFFRDLNYAPHAGQLKIHNSSAPRRIVACGVRWGKSKCASMEALASAMEPAERSTGWVVAPTYELADKVYREILVTIGTHLKHRLVSIRENEKRCILRNMAGGESEIRAKSADNPISLLGEGLDWLICDEAARLKPSIWHSYLSQRLWDRKGWALFISTPAGKNWFYDLFRRGNGNDPDYESWNAPSIENPHLDPRFIEKERERIPLRVYEQEYLANFQEGYGSVFRNVRDCATGELRDPQPGQQYSGGLDLAKVEDFTVLTFLNSQRECTFVDRFHRIPWDAQLARVHAHAGRHGNPRLLVDSTGAGEPLFDALRKGGCRVQAYPFTAASKADLINHLALLFEKKEITIPRAGVCPTMVEELESYEYDVSESGAVKMGAPRGQHDDMVVSLALAAWLSKRNRVPVFLWA